MQFTTRDAIGLREPSRRSPMTAHQGVIVHHGASPNYPSDPHATWRGYQNYHMDNHGWSDIGYSWGVTAEGEILEGRGWGVYGTHTIGYNGSAHAVCYLGNSDLQPVPEPARRAIVAVCDEHDRRYGVGYRRTHGDVNNTTCPGTDLQAWVSAGMPLESEPLPDDPEGESMALPHLVYNRDNLGDPTCQSDLKRWRRQISIEDAEAIYGPDWLDKRYAISGDLYHSMNPYG